MRRSNLSGLLLLSICAGNIYLAAIYLRRVASAEAMPAAVVPLLLAIMSVIIAGFTASELRRG